MATPHYAPLAVRRALRQVGQDIRTARLRRNLTMETVAQRAFTSRPTLQRIERGDSGVGIGIYASVLHALGLIDNFRNLANPAGDEVGLAQAEATLRKRAGSPRGRRNPDEG